jgi:hypothetical protein
MPFVFLVVAIGLIVIAIRGTQAQAFQLLTSEFTGTGSFIPWALAIFVLGGLGYIPVIRPFTRALLLLVVLVIFLKNGTGLFAQFRQQIANPVASSAPTATAGATGTNSLSSLGSLFGPASAAGTAATGGGQAFVDNTSSFGSNATGAGSTGGTAGANLVNVYDSNGQWIGLQDPTFQP